jgi:hypothetical protein
VLMASEVMEIAEHHGVPLKQTGEKAELRVA